MATILVLVLGGLPLCTGMPPEVEARVGSGWRERLEQYSHRSVVVLEGCVGERLTFSLEGEAVVVHLTARTKERQLRLPPSGAAESLALLVAPMVAEEAPPVRRAPVVVEAPVAARHERGWAYLDVGVALAAREAISGVVIGGAYRFDEWSLGVEMAQFGAPVGLGAGTPRIWVLNGVIWYGHDFFERRVRVDGGLGIGAVSNTSPWDSGASSYFWPTVAVSTRGIARVRYALTDWLDVHGRGEVGLATQMPGNREALTFAALLLGVEVTFGH